MQPLLSPAEQSLVLQVVEVTQADEVDIAAELMRPQRWWSRYSPRKGPVGYGAEAALDLISPYVIIVVVWAYGVVHHEAKHILEERLRSLTRTLLRQTVSAPATPPGNEDKPAEQRQIRKGVQDYAEALGLEREKAAVLAAAVMDLVAQPSE